MVRRKKRCKSSKAEKEILSLLHNRGYNVVPQFVVKGLPFIYDFYFPKLNILLEYQGDYWHCHPQQYKSGELVKMAGAGELLVDYVWERDKMKRKLAESQGFIVCELWESDYQQNGMESIERCLTTHGH